MNWLFEKLRMPAVNQVILIIILAEFILTTADALIGPLFALFVVQDMGAAVTTVGFAIAIYWITKSIVQLFVARYLDKNHGEVDDYYSMLAGLLIVIVTIYSYYFVREVWQIYLLQFFLALGNSFVVPPFYAIFTRHIDKDREASEWAMRSSFSLGAGSALGGALSGLLAAAIGIRPIFLINGTLMLIGFFVLLFLGPYIKPRTPRDLAQFYEQKRV